jgi:hypothetical protein
MHDRRGERIRAPASDSVVAVRVWLSTRDGIPRSRLDGKHKAYRFRLEEHPSLSANKVDPKGVRLLHQAIDRDLADAV